MRTLRKWEVASALFVAVIGTLLHFTYAWSGENALIASFSAINESVWEHTKMVFFPLLVFSAVEYFFVRKDAPRFIAVKVVQVIIAIIAIVSFFYTYSGITGLELLWVDILSFYVIAILGNVFAYKMIKAKRVQLNNPGALVLLLLLITFFMVGTYKTPDLPVFEEHGHEE